MRCNNSKLALILVFSLLASMFVGVGTASAAFSISVPQLISTFAGDNQNVGMLRIVIQNGAISENDFMKVTLPTDYALASEVTGPVSVYSLKANEVVVPYAYDGETNGILKNDIAIENIDQNSFRIISKVNQSNGDFMFLIKLGNVNIAPNASDCVVQLDGFGGFPSSELILAKISGASSGGGSGSVSYGDPSGIFVNQVTNVDPGKGINLKSVRVVVPSYSIQAGDSVVVSLPNEWEISGGINNQPAMQASMFENQVVVPSSYIGDPNGLVLAGAIGTGNPTTDQIAVTPINNNSFKIQALDDQSAYHFVFYVFLGNINVSAYAKDCIVSFEGKGGFPNGQITLAKAITDRSINLASRNASASNENFSFELRISEEFPSSLKISSNSIVLRLPRGFEWTNVNEIKSTDFKSIKGEFSESDFAYSTNSNNSELRISFKGIGCIPAQNGNPEIPGEKTNIASACGINLSFKMADKLRAIPGAINVGINGESSIKQSSLKVGDYLINKTQDLYGYMDSYEQGVYLEAINNVYGLSDGKISEIFFYLMTTELEDKLGGVDNLPQLLPLIRDALMIDYFDVDTREFAIEAYKEEYKEIIQKVMGFDVTADDIINFARDLNAAALQRNDEIMANPQEVSDFINLSDQHKIDRICDEGIEVLNMVLNSSKHTKIAQSFRALGWSSNMIMATFKSLVVAIDPNFEAQKAIIAAYIRSQIVITGADGDRINDWGLIAESSNSPLDIKIMYKGIDLTKAKNSEQKPVAVWQVNNNAVTIDSNGQLIARNGGEEALATLSLNNEDKTIIFEFVISIF